MKIGIFSDRYLPQTDGISVSIETFRSELEKLGHEVYVFAPKPSLRYVERSSRIFRFPAVKGLFFDDWLTSFFFPPRVMKLIDKLNLDIVHYQTPGQIGLMGLYYGLQNDLPIITTYHTDLYEYVKHYPQVLPGTIALSLLAPVITRGKMEEFRQMFSSMKPERSIDVWNQKIVVRGLTLIHNHCDVVITPSKKFEKQLKSWKTKSQITTLPTGVDKITTKIHNLAEFRAHHDLTPADKIILLVCRIGTEKNIGLLIKAFDLVGAKVPEAKVIIIGPGDDLDLFKSQAAASKFPNRIIFTGYIPYQDLGAYYDTATVFAFPSLADTQGLAVNEATCAGLPVVMCDREISEVVKNNENGFYAKSSPKDFANKLITILTDTKLRSRMSKRSLELAKEVSAAKQAVKLADLYTQTIQRHPHRDDAESTRQR
jgi:glycosyltransferase involved in cell wall biosynthesis